MHSPARGVVCHHGFTATGVIGTILVLAQILAKPRMREPRLVHAVQRLRLCRRELLQDPMDAIVHFDLQKKSMNRTCGVEPRPRDRGL